MDKKYTFAQRLRELLDYNHIRQVDLASRTGISKSSLSHYLKGDWEGKQDVIYKISSAYGVSSAWLMGVDCPMQSDLPGVVNSAFLNVGSYIHYRRKALGLTLEDVGKAVGVVKSTVKKWESGDIANMRRDKIALLSKILQTSPLVFISDEQLDEQLIDRLCSLSPEELQKVDSFVQGLIANR